MVTIATGPDGVRQQANVLDTLKPAQATAYRVFDRDKTTEVQTFYFVVHLVEI